MTIQELLRKLHVDFLETGHHHCRPGWVQLKECPYCRSDNYHLGFNLTGRYFFCWKCRGHHPAQVLSKLGLGRPAVKEFLAGADAEFALPTARVRQSLREPVGRAPMLPAHRRYLAGRGYDPDEIAALWSVEGIGIASRLSWRLYIPITVNGSRVSWTTRAIGERVTQRYISASAEEEAVNHKSVLYGREHCLHSVVVCEGPTDAWAVGPGACCTFGTAFSTAQVRELVKIPHRFICFDSSPDAQAHAEDLANQLSCFPGTTENITLDAKDPGSASPKELKLLRQVARL